MNPEFSNTIRQICLEAGFLKVGFSQAAELTTEKSFLKEWIEKKMNAGMHWIDASFEKRVNPQLVMSDVKSVISLAYLYDTPHAHSDDKNIPKISRYAWGERDYHKVLKKKLKGICVEIEKLSDGIKTKYFVDDGPVMDKAWAVRSGIGWLGKNTNVICPETGSFFFISTIYTNIRLDCDEPVEELCKSCSICINECPTGALNEFVIDANKCVSYQTIENRNEIPVEIKLNGWVFGCDICQDVCPFNGKNIFTEDKNFFPRAVNFTSNYTEYLKSSETEFNEKFSGTPVKRTKYSGWIRNLKKAQSEIF